MVHLDYPAAPIKPIEVFSIPETNDGDLLFSAIASMGGAKVILVIASLSDGNGSMVLLEMTTRIISRATSSWINTMLCMIFLNA